MNNWSAVGYIFLGFGLVFLAFGAFLGLSVAGAYSSVGAQGTLAQATMLGVMIPWLLIAALCFVVGIVGVVMGYQQEKRSN